MVTFFSVAGRNAIDMSHWIGFKEGYEIIRMNFMVEPILALRGYLILGNKSPEMLSQEEEIYI